MCHHRRRPIGTHFDGYVNGVTRCDVNTSTACWHCWMSDADPQQWILAKRNSAGEPPLMSIPNNPKPQNWIEFAAKWPYESKDKKKCEFKEE